MKRIDKDISKTEFFTSKVVIGDKDISIKFPKTIISQICAEDKEVYWAVVNGVLQVSGCQPQATIPILSLGEFDTTRV